MHDLIREMGKEIVCGESNDPSKLSHLWDPHDVYQILENATGTRAIQSLRLLMGSGGMELCLNPIAFDGMPNLKFLKLHDLKSQKIKTIAPKNFDINAKWLKAS